MKKAQRLATKRAARKIRGSEQSEEHKAKRFEAMRITLATKPIPCRKCGEMFIRTISAQRYCSGRCWLAVHRKDRPQKRRFTIPADEYKRLLALQQNRCALCGVLSGSNGRNERLAVDHCHDRMVVRGLLCHRCNTGLGLLRDDVAVMERAIAYLRGS